MKLRVFPALLLGVALGACEQTNQELPFAVDGTSPTTKTVTPGAESRVSNPAGASLQFPSGAVSAPTSVTIQPVAAPTSTQKSGAVVSTSFRVDPVGTVLAKPAEAELKFAAPTDASQAWLASVVNVTGNRVQEIGNVRVDIRSRLVETQVRQLGTMSVVIPDARAVFRARRASAARSLAPLTLDLAATGTDSLVVNCGDPDNRCENLSVEASDNLLTMVEDAAAIYPLIVGKLHINGSSATGQVTLNTSIRVRLKSGATAENIDFSGLLEPTASTVVSENASEIRMTNVHQVITGTTADQTGTRDVVATLVIPKGVSSGSITLTRNFTMRNSAGQLENAFVRVTFPVQIYQ